MVKTLIFNMELLSEITSLTVSLNGYSWQIPLTFCVSSSAIVKKKQLLGIDCICGQQKLNLYNFKSNNHKNGE